MNDDFASQDPKPEWSASEQWAWQQVSAGEIANFNERYGKLELESLKSEELMSRFVGERFLRDILLREPFRSRLKHQGVRIVGAWVNDPIDLDSVHLDRPLWLDNCLFEKDVSLLEINSTAAVTFYGSVFRGSFKLLGARFTQRLSLNKVRCTGELDMSGLDADTVFMRDAKFAKVRLNRGRVSKLLDMSGTTFSKQLEMDRFEIDKVLLMDRAVLESASLAGGRAGELSMVGSKCSGAFDMSDLDAETILMMSSEIKQVSLRRAKVSRLLRMDNARFGALEMDKLEVGKSLSMDHVQSSEVRMVGAKLGNLSMVGTDFRGEVALRGTSVGGQLDMKNAKLNGRLNMQRIHVAMDLDMSSANFVDVDLQGATVEGNVDLSRAKLTSLSLIGARILSDFRLGTTQTDSKVSGGPPEWNRDSRLELRNAQIGVIQDGGEKSWPEKLSLRGFRFCRLGGLIG